MLGTLGGSDSKWSACSAADPGLIPVLGRSPGEGNDDPPQYSCLGNPMDFSPVHGIAKSWTQLSDFTFKRHGVGHNLATKPPSHKDLFSGWIRGKESTYKFRRRGFSPWVGKISWRRKWQPTPVISCLENRIDSGAWWAQSMGSQRVRHNLVTKQQQQGFQYIPCMEYYRRQFPSSRF